MKKYSGGLLDNRKDTSKDFSSLEIGSSSDIKYLTLKQALKSLKEIRDQKGTSACGAYAGELVASHLKDNKYSQAKVYRNRRNFPGEGMYQEDVCQIIVNLGVAESDNTPKTENAYNSISKDFTPIFKASGYTMDFTPSFEELARVSNVLKLPQFVLLYSKNGKEYGKEKPIVDETFNSPSTALIRHFVVISPNAGFIEKKKKYLLIQDSSSFGRVFVRHFDENWIAKRILSSASLFGSSFIEKDTKPKCFNFTRDLTVGMRGDDVLALQTILQQLGFFPATLNGVQFKPTNYFGGMTRQAVKDFQKEYEVSILWAVGLKLPTGYFGKSSIKQLKVLCS